MDSMNCAMRNLRSPFHWWDYLLPRKDRPSPTVDRTWTSTIQWVTRGICSNGNTHNQMIQPINDPRTYSSAKMELMARHEQVRLNCSDLEYVGQIYSCLAIADDIHQSGNDWRPVSWIVLGPNGNWMVTILGVGDGSAHRRHVERIYCHALRYY